MAALHRVRTGLLGFNGGPGVITMYGTDGPALASALQTMWGTILGFFPIPVKLQVESVGDIIESTTGALTGQWSTAAFAQQQGTSNTAYPGPVGGLMRWETGVIANGHRVRGRSFIVPLTGDAYQNDGTLSATTQAAFLTASAGLVTSASGNLSVWHRPFPGAPAVGTKPARPAYAGAGFLVTGSSVPDKAVVLRSRRD